MRLLLDTHALKSPVARFIPEQLAVNSFSLLPIEFAHVARVARFAFHHRDPFDRLLAAQAVIEDLTLVSADPIFRDMAPNACGERHVLAVRSST